MSPLLLLPFSGFCAFLFCYVAYGLVKGHLSGSGKLDASPDGFRFTPKTAAIYVPLCLLGGALTGYIGIGIEKVVFCLLTWHLGMDVRQACLTSITLVGWISAVSLVFHLLCSAPHVAPHSALAASARMDEALPHLHCAPRSAIAASKASAIGSSSTRACSEQQSVALSKLWLAVIQRAAAEMSALRST